MALFFISSVFFRLSSSCFGQRRRRKDTTDSYVTKDSWDNSSLHDRWISKLLGYPHQRRLENYFRSQDVLAQKMDNRRDGRGYGHNVILITMILHQLPPRLCLAVKKSAQPLEQRKALVVELKSPGEGRCHSSSLSWSLFPSAVANAQRTATHRL